MTHHTRTGRHRRRTRRGAVALSRVATTLLRAEARHDVSSARPSRGRGRRRSRCRRAGRRPWAIAPAGMAYRDAPSRTPRLAAPCQRTRTAGRSRSHPRRQRADVGHGEVAAHRCLPALEGRGHGFRQHRGGRARMPVGGTDPGTDHGQPSPTPGFFSQARLNAVGAGRHGRARLSYAGKRSSRASGPAARAPARRRGLQHARTGPARRRIPGHAHRGSHSKHYSAASLANNATRLDGSPLTLVRGRPWERRRCTPTVRSVHTDRRNPAHRPP